MGRSGQILQFRTNQTLENNIENSKLIIFKNCAHNVHLEQPNQFNKTIKDFLL